MAYEEERSPGSVRLQRKITLLNGITIIVGGIIGSGIFISPKAVFMHSGSIGLTLLVWTIAGLGSLVGALCYAELGTTIMKSGGDYAYIKEAWGPMLAFLFLWVNVLVLQPSLLAILALTFADYIVYPFYPDPTCHPPQASLFLTAISCLVVLATVNSMSVRWTTRVQDLFTFAKMSVLAVIIITGLVRLGKGYTDQFENAFDTTPNANGGGSITIAFYAGFFAYGGWNSLNFLTEEMKDPHRNLPLAIIISLPIVTGVYVMTNVAYFSVMTPQEVLLSKAVAVTFGYKVLGSAAFLIPVGVAWSVFGTINGGFLLGSRLNFVAARDGHLPTLLSMIHVRRNTPIPSLCLSCMLAICYLFINNIEQLLTYFSFVTWGSTAVTISGLLKLRWTKPDLERPLRMNILLIISFLLVCVGLVIMGVVAAPLETTIGICFTLTGIPVYFTVAVKWKNIPKSFKNLIKKVTYFLQKLLLVVKPDEKFCH
ncbi:Y+L amino acid transporter 2-like [Antedon mediterranea]|uniref:Y+L amino acid transporter 2-like n=1 Tax=Antedon mediterranea TaxID=105859 RepID=UPI003AF71E7B